MEKIINVYEKYIDKIWNDLSDEDKIRLEGHFNGIINEIDDIIEDSEYNVELIKFSLS